MSVMFVVNQSLRHDFRTQVVEKARADAEKVKLLGLAEATAIENIGRAEAEAMRMKAAAYKQYGEAATLSLVFEALPKVILDTILDSFDKNGLMVYRCYYYYYHHHFFAIKL